jgi:hypothetical protein
MSARPGRPPGLPKSGGRKKGTPNRATASVREKFDQLGYDPVFELIRISRDSKTPLNLQVQIHFILCPFAYPKRKPVDELNAEPPKIEVMTQLDPEVDTKNANRESSAKAEAATGKCVSE